MRPIRLWGRLQAILEVRIPELCADLAVVVPAIVVMVLVALPDQIRILIGHRDAPRVGHPGASSAVPGCLERCLVGLVHGGVSGGAGKICSVSARAFCSSDSC